MTLPRRLHYGLFPGDRDESYRLFVSSRGFLKSSDHHSQRVRSNARTPPMTPVRRLREGDSVYVGTKALPAFVERVLPRISRPFVLVTGDSDVGVNTQQLPAKTLETLLDNALVESWFAQNLTKIHDKQIHIPLGIDYHSLAKRRPVRWGSFQTPADQERELIQIAREAPLPAARRPLGYCNWHFAMQRGSRTACMDRIDHSAAHFEAEPAERTQSWRTNAGMLFTISPTGNGVDCHRTWEAIALGSIPIVDRTELSPLFRNLPVVEVDDWSIVTPRFLEDRAATMLSQRYDFAPLFLQYWRRRFTGKTAPALAMTLTEFVQGGTEIASRIFDSV